jgi:hypothetical protein
MTCREVEDARRWAAFHCVGTYQLLMEIQACLEDVAGMLARGQPRVAAYSAREVLLLCMSVRAIAAGGEIWIDPHDPYHDPFDGLDDAECAVMPRILGEFCRADTEADPQAAARKAYERLAEYVAGTERLLGFASSPASVRTPKGLFPALRAARELLGLADAAQLPPVLPKSWTSIQDATER